MSNDLRELYQEVILDHSKRPRNFGPLPDANREVDGRNPLCGDKTTIFLKVEEGVVKDAHFVGAGCSISMASASMMTEAVKGHTLVEAEALFKRFHELITGNPAAAGARGESEAEAREDAEAAVELGKLAVFSGVCEYPARVKCAALAWHTLKAALAEGHAPAPVSTEEGQ
jgi:nitrogen fixation protein NifU and related proteins